MPVLLIWLKIILKSIYIFWI